MPTPENDRSRDPSLYDNNLWTADADYLRNQGFHYNEGGYLDSGGPAVWLIPAAKWKSIPVGMKVVCFNGTSRVVGRDYVSDDTRGGFLPFGIVPGDTWATGAPTAIEVKDYDERRINDLMERLNAVLVKRL